MYILAVQNAVAGAEPHSLAIMNEDGRALAVVPIEMLLYNLEQMGIGCHSKQDHVAVPRKVMLAVAMEMTIAANGQWVSRTKAQEIANTAKKILEVQE